MGISSALLLIVKGDAKLLLPVCQEDFLPWANPTGLTETKGEQDAEYEFMNVRKSGPVLLVWKLYRQQQFSL